MANQLKTFVARVVTASIFGSILLCLESFSPLNAAPPQLEISGNQVLNASNGCAVRLKGVDCSGLEYSSTGDQSGNAPMTTVDGVKMEDFVSIANEAVNVWHANLIRIATNQDYWFGCNGANQTAYRDELQAFVNFCSNNNLYVDFDLHWSGTAGTASAPCGAGWGTATAQRPMPDMNAVTFWSSVGSAYANNPAVMFDLYNEPYDPAGTDTTFWNIWRNGGATGFNNPGPSNTPGLQTLLNVVRSAGASNICLAGGLQWAYDLKGVASTSTQCNGGSCALTQAFGYGVLYTAHIYSNKGAAVSTTWDPYVTVASTTNAIDIEEFGAAATDPAGWDNTLLGWINGLNNKGYVYNATAWSFTTDDSPSLLTSFTGFTTTAYHGAPVSTWLYNVNQTPTPNCSGGNTPTFTLTATRTNTPTNTPTITSTTTRTNTPTNTLTTTPTFTRSMTPTVTGTSTRTSTPTATLTATLGNTSTYTLTLTPTRTSTNTSTVTQVLTATSTQTPTTTRTVTATVTTTFTQTPLFTGTATATSQFTATTTSTLTPTMTRTNTLTQTLTTTRTFTTTVTATQTPTTTCTQTPLFTGTATATLQFSATNTLSPTATFSFTPTRTATPTNTPTRTLTATSTSTGTSTPTSQFSPTNTLSPTSTPTFTTTFTPTHTGTSTYTPTITITPTVTDTSTMTYSSTPTLSPTNTFTSTYTGTPTWTGTSTNTPTVTYTPTVTNTWTVTPTPTITPIYTYTQTLTPTSTSTQTFTFTPSWTPTSAIVNFGTGSAGMLDTLAGSNGVTAVQVTVNNSSGTTVTLTSLTVTTGTGNTSDITSVSVLINGSPAGLPSVFTGSTATLNLNNYVLQPSSQTLEILLSFSVNATGTYPMTISGVTGTSGNNGGQPVGFNGLSVSGYTVVVHQPTQTPTFSPTSTVTSAPTPLAGKVGIYPNPVTGPTVQILPPLYNGISKVRVEVFTLAFRKVQDTPYSSWPSGTAVFLSLTGKDGNPLANGIYYVVVTTNSGRAIGKLLILK